MPNKLSSLVLSVAAAALLSGCVLAPQTIELNQQVELAGAQNLQRDALVRVLDQRGKGEDYLGHRGGRLAENSPLLLDQPLKQLLTHRLQQSLAQLGFGKQSGPALANAEQPVKVQLDIRAFDYSCNEGVLVSRCNMDMQLMLTVINGAKTFTKPYQLREERRVAAAPVASYNQVWLNDMLERLWVHMFTDAELRQALGVAQ